ncbi:hypothetical protein J1P26_10745 [Neobacillus sp. MM2021_6]|uniref:hypothetical protein n=1 Tax=Bacillaceae TaxID=186817 RepID=UPI001409AA7A|nr:MULTISPECIES: hypothetical protein [Bacillaceae]MBO0960201.1 hypothetical protein [Neobacillus sp. MM2021_6]NHC18568.1 hypothetical protein [Bacillus sp. MM2020_4]
MNQWNILFQAKNYVYGKEPSLLISFIFYIFPKSFLIRAKGFIDFLMSSGKAIQL